MFTAALPQPQFAPQGKDVASQAEVAHARLEERVAAQDAANDLTFRNINEKLDKLASCLKEIDHKLSKQQGFVAGITFTIGALLGAAASIFSYFSGR